MGELIKAKLKASGIHLGISIIIFIGILYLILIEWYPEPFFTAEGGWKGIRLMALVDLVLGPTLTLIVFNHKKSKLEMGIDLSIIAMVQIFALIWGGYTVYSKRPIALAFYDYAFFTVTDDYYAAQGESRPDFSTLSGHVPPLVAVRMPKSDHEQSHFSKLTSKAIPIYAHAELYEPIINQLDLMKKNQVDVEEIMHYNPRMKQDILAMTNNDVNSYVFMSLQAKFRNVIIVISEKGEYVGMVKVHDREI